MTGKEIESAKMELWRRIAVKIIVLPFWAACMALMLLQGDSGLASEVSVGMIAAILGVWAVSTIRDVRRLRDDEYLKRSAIAENDESNIQIMYRATRLATVAVACITPIAVCVFAFLGMEEAMNTLAGGTCVFLIAYLISWYCIGRTC